MAGIGLGRGKSLLAAVILSALGVFAYFAISRTSPDTVGTRPTHNFPPNAHVVSLTDESGNVIRYGWSLEGRNIAMDILCPNTTTPRSIRARAFSNNVFYKSSPCFDGWATSSCALKPGQVLQAKDIHLENEDRFLRGVMIPPRAGYRSTHIDNGKVLYYIMTTDEPVGMFLESLSAIYTRTNYYLIHIDFKPTTNSDTADAFMKQIETLVGRYSNIAVMPQKHSFRGSWGGVSLVWMELSGFRVALDMWGDWGYFINYSPNTWPLRTQEHISNELRKLNGSNWHHSDNCAVNSELDRGRSARCWQECLYSNLELAPESCHVDEKGMEEFGWYTRCASQWKVLHRSLLEKFTYEDLLSDKGRRAYQFFRTTYISDEHFLPTTFGVLDYPKLFVILPQSPIHVDWGANGMAMETNVARAVQIAQEGTPFFVRKVYNPIEARRIANLTGVQYSLLL